MKERIVIGLFLKGDEEINVHTTYNTHEKGPEKRGGKCQKKSGIHEDRWEKKCDAVMVHRGEDAI